MHNNIADIRRDYSHKSLSEYDVDANAIKQFEKWKKQKTHQKREIKLFIGLPPFGCH